MSDSDIEQVTPDPYGLRDMTCIELIDRFGFLSRIYGRYGDDGTDTASEMRAAWAQLAFRVEEMEKA